MTLKRITLGIASFAVSLLMFAAVGVIWVLYSESGTRWSITQVEAITDGVLQTQGVTGSWESGLKVANVRYADSATELEVVNLEPKIDLANLLSGELYIARLNIDSIRYRPLTQTTEDPPSDTGAFPAPINITIMDASIGRFEFDGDTQEHAENIQLALTWIDTILDISEFSLTAREAQIGGNAKLGLVSPLSANADLEWSLAPEGSAPWSGRGTLMGDLTQLIIKHELLAPYAVSTNGSLYLEDALGVELRTTSAALEYILDGRALAMNDVELQLDGWIDDYQFNVDGTFASDGLPTTRINGNGAGNMDGLRIASLRAAANSSSILAAGEVAWGGTPNWQLGIQIKGLNPALFAKDWPGDLDGGFGFSGSWSEADLSFDISEIQITGSLRDRPANLEGRIRQAEGSWFFDAIKARSGNNRLAFDGSYGQRLAVQYDANFPNFAELNPDWRGSAQGKGSLGGTIEQPTIELDLSASGLRIPGYAVDKLTASGQLMPSGPPSDLVIDAQSVELGEQKVDRLQAKLHGIVADHQLIFSADSEALKATLELAGGWDQARWAGELLDSSFELDQLGRWQQSAAAQLLITPEQAEVTELCWQSKQSSACVDGMAGVNKLDATGRLKNLAIELLAAGLPDGVTAAGETSAELAFTGSLQAPSVQLVANAPEIRLEYYSSADDETVSIVARNTQLLGSLNPEQLDIDLRVVELGSEGELAFVGQLLNWSGEAPRLQSSLQGSIPDASFLAIVIPEITEVAGSVEADLSLAGDLATPSMGGYLRLSDGEARLSGAGIKLVDITMEARPAGRSRVAINGSARSGEGQLDMAGHIELDGAAGWPVNATVRGERFTALNIPELEAIVSPDLEISGTANNLLVRGKLVTPRVVVQLRELPVQAVKVSPDVVVYRSAAAEPERPAILKIQTELQVQLGEEVSFSGFGFNSKLSGNLQVRTATGRPVEGRGVVRIVSGNFKAYGQKLEIRNGRLIFTGPLDDPTLSIEAIREIDPVTVGIRVGGTGQTPVATIFSEPAMSEANALSYLVTGRPLGEASGADSDDIRNAAVALGLKQAVPVTEEISRAIGLDELGLDTDDSSGGSVMAGKQITKDLYVRYSYGLFNSIGALLLRYRLSDSLNLEARSAEDQSMDLIYSREIE